MLRFKEEKKRGSGAGVGLDSELFNASGNFFDRSVNIFRFFPVTGFSGAVSGPPLILLAPLLPRAESGLPLVCCGVTAVVRARAAGVVLRGSLKYVLRLAYFPLLMKV